MPEPAVTEYDAELGIEEVLYVARAMWNDKTIAESDDVVHLEGNVYFPREALVDEHFEESSHHSICAWKGQASYLDVVVDGKRNENAAWYYPHPLPPARKIKGRVAFWHGVEVEEQPQHEQVTR